MTEKEQELDSNEISRRESLVLLKSILDLHEACGSHSEARKYKDIISLVETGKPPSDFLTYSLSKQENSVLEKRLAALEQNSRKIEDFFIEELGNLDRKITQISVEKNKITTPDGSLMYRVRGTKTDDESEKYTNILKSNNEDMLDLLGTYRAAFAKLDGWRTTGKPQLIYTKDNSHLVLKAGDYIHTAIDARAAEVANGDTPSPVGDKTTQTEDKAWNPVTDGFWYWQSGFVLHSSSNNEGVNQLLISIGNTFQTREEAEDEGKWRFETKLVYDVKLRVFAQAHNVTVGFLLNQVTGVNHFQSFGGYVLKILGSDAKRYLTGEV